MPALNCAGRGEVRELLVCVALCTRLKFFDRGLIPFVVGRISGGKLSLRISQSSCRLVAGFGRGTPPAVENGGLSSRPACCKGGKEFRWCCRWVENADPFPKHRPLFGRCHLLCDFDEICCSLGSGCPYSSEISQSTTSIFLFMKTLFTHMHRGPFFWYTCHLLTCHASPSARFLSSWWRARCGGKHITRETDRHQFLVYFFGGPRIMKKTTKKTTKKRCVQRKWASCSAADQILYSAITRRIQAALQALEAEVRNCHKPVHFGRFSGSPCSVLASLLCLGF